MKTAATVAALLTALAGLGGCVPATPVAAYYPYYYGTKPLGQPNVVTPVAAPQMPATAPGAQVRTTPRNTAPTPLVPMTGTPVPAQTTPGSPPGAPPAASAACSW